MVTDKFNMVDMEGVDIILDQGIEIPGLYQKLVESIAQCRYQCLYNWKSNGVNIPPSFVELVVDPDDGNISINTGIFVTSEDVIMSAAFDADDILYDPSKIYQNGTVGAALKHKQDAPQVSGSSGQVLGLDSNLDPVWINQSSGTTEDWIKIRDDTLDEATSTYSINTDSNGNPFELKDAIIYIIATGGSPQSCYLSIDNTNLARVQVNIGNIVNTGVVRTVIRCERVFDSWNIMMNTPMNNYRDLDKSNQQMFCGLLSSVDPVNIARIVLQVTSFPVGTRFLVYGRSV